MLVCGRRDSAPGGASLLPHLRRDNCLHSCSILFEVRGRAEEYQHWCGGGIQKNGRRAQSLQECIESSRFVVCCECLPARHWQHAHSVSHMHAPVGFPLSINVSRRAATSSTTIFPKKTVERSSPKNCATRQSHVLSRVANLDVPRLNDDTA